MTNAGKFTDPICEEAQASIATNTRRLGSKELQHSSPAQSFPKDDGASSIRPVTWNACFAKSRPIVLNLVHGRLRLGDLNAPPWHIDAVAGASTPSLPIGFLPAGGLQEVRIDGPDEADPGRSPLVNSKPAASKVGRIASSLAVVSNSPQKTTVGIERGI